MSAPPPSIVVAGAGLAGLRACEGLRERGFDGRLTLVGDEPHLPYDRPPLSKQFLAGTWGRERVLLRSPEKMASLELDERLGPSHRAAALDVGRRRLRLVSGEEVSFDGIVLATGSHARRLPGINEPPGAHVLRTLDDAEALRGELVAGRRLAIAGAGFIGLEVAATARGLGVDVSVVEPLATPLPALGPVTGGACEVMHREEGVVFHLERLIESAERAGGGLRCRLSGGEVLEVDVLLVGVGAVPSVSWLEGSGLEADHAGVTCDAALMAAPGVAVAGDIARWPSFDGPVRVEHRTNAAEQGDQAAGSLLAALGLAPPSGGREGEVAEAEEVAQGEGSAPPYWVPYVWSDQYKVKIQVLGLPRAADEVVVVEGDPLERRFLALHGREGRLVGVVGFSRPRHVMSLRPLLERRASLEEARQAIG